MIKHQKLLFVTLILVMVLAGFTSPAIAQTDQPPPPINDDKVVVGQTFILKEDQTLNGDLVVIGGTAILKLNSIVEGEVVLIGGVLEVYGTINGDVQALGGSLELMDSAVLSGSLFNFGSTVTQLEGATIQGQQIANLPFTFDLEDVPFVDQAPVPNVTVRKIGGFLGNFLWAVLQVLAVAALAILVLLLLPKPTERIAKAIGQQPFVHWGIGLLTAFAAPIVFVIMIITILLIPLGIIGFLVLAFALLYGWIALGYEIGRRLLKNYSTDLSPALIAGIGTLILTAISRMAAIIPCVGWTVGAVFSLFGLGAIILTRAGTRNYPLVDPRPYQPVSPSPANNPKGIEPGLADILADEEEDEIYETLDDDFDDDLSDTMNSSENENKSNEE